MYKTSRNVLDARQPVELVLELKSFAGGENTIGEDQELKLNEARKIENWDAIALGGMKRSKGFNLVADGGATWSEDIDLVIQHKEGASTRVYAVVEGDLVYEDGVALTLDDNGAFSTGILCHGVSVGGVLYITNSTDNIKYKTLAGDVTALTNVPDDPRERIHYHKFRLIAEGGGRRVYGSRAGTGNFNASDGFSLTNDAWNIDLPEDTKGGVSIGDDFYVFTEFEAYALYNMPDIAYRQIIGSHGCSAPYSIVKAKEGIFLVSRYPTLGVYLWVGSSWENLTKNHNFVEKINFGQRIFGTYRNDKYYLFYNETGSGVNYPNKLKIFDVKFGRWMDRPVNTAIGDNFGYPCLLTHANNELYVGSSLTDKLYELETADDSDEGENTEADYTTKDFSSADFSVNTGGQFPIDEVRMKIIKLVLTAYGTKGTITIQWSADRGQITGSQSFDVSASGDLLNTTFILNSSYLSATPPAKTIAKSVANSAVGRRFKFQIINANTGERPEIKKLKIHAIAAEEL